MDNKQLNKELRAIIKRNDINCFQLVKTFLERFDINQKDNILNCNKETKPVIFKAVKYKNKEVINYLLKDCEVDIDTVMEYSKEFCNCFEVTPLYYAAILGDMDIMEYLIDHGADIFWQNDDDLMPVHGAIRYGNIRAVDFLVEAMNGLDIDDSSSLLACLPDETMLNNLLAKGLDPNHKDTNGYTSLHEAISYGKKGLFMRSNYKTIMMLVNAGADINIKDSFGLDATLSAARHNDKITFDYLSRQKNVCNISVISGYELLGARDIYNSLLHKGIKQWRRAMFIRYSDPKSPILKPPAEPKAIFDFATEIQTFHDLGRLNDADKLTLFAQAALVRERVLGWNHPSSLHSLTNRFSEKLRKRGKYKRCFDMLLYSRNGYMKFGHLVPKSLSTVEQIVKTLFASAEEGNGDISTIEILNLLQSVLEQTEAYENEIGCIQYELDTYRSYNSEKATDASFLLPPENNLNQTESKTEFANGFLLEQGEEHVSCVENLIKSQHEGFDCNEIGYSKTSDERSHTKDQNEQKINDDMKENDDGTSLDDSNDFYNQLGTHQLLTQLEIITNGRNKLFSYSMDIFYFILEKCQEHEFDKETKLLFCKYILSGIRGYGDQSMLHMASHRLSERQVKGKNTNEFKVNLPVLVAMFDELIKSGASVNAVDHHLNTPLHLALQPVTEQRTFNGTTPNYAVKKLLELGSHVDACNENGVSTFDTLIQMDVDIDVAKNITLQCLAARAIMRYQITYKEQVPQHLELFIAMHNKKKFENS